ncbi:MAG: hypothetical protein IJB98_03690 [Clostridia bacterium]|nr:hypothetical protein [Clostridia bacterium]
MVARYSYDSLSRLIREDNKDFETTTTYEYDAGGNILFKKVYTFTLIDNLDIEEPLQIIPYTYPTSGWRDQLMFFDGQEIKNYDALGNPWFYRGKQLEWSHSRQLDKFADIAEFTYNASGIKATKKETKFNILVSFFIIKYVLRHSYPCIHSICWWLNGISFTINITKL